MHRDEFNFKEEIIAVFVSVHVYTGRAIASSKQYPTIHGRIEY
jgi:hypothetical protein